MPRKSLSKRVRFEIFKRDGFRCVYCGASPEQALLRVDHVEPASLGGSDDPSNLVTSCDACNGGKSNVPLSKRALAPTMSVEDAQEHAEQIKAYLEATRNVLEAKRDLVGLAEAHWEDVVGFTLTVRERAYLKLFVERLGTAAVIDSIGIAASRKPATYPSQAAATFVYFCGVCWKRIREKDAGVTASAAPPEIAPSQSHRDDDYEWTEVGWGDILNEATVADVDALFAPSRRIVVRVKTGDVCALSSANYKGWALRSFGSAETDLHLYPSETASIEVYLDIQALRLLIRTEKRRPTLISIPWRAVVSLTELDGSGYVLDRWVLSPRSPWAQLLRVPVGETP